MTLRLYKHQIEGVRFLQERNRCLLAFDMGLGKTATALAALDDSRLPAVVVCPASVRNVWENETAKFRPDLYCQVVRSSKDEVDMGSAVTVTSYDLFGKVRVPRPRTLIYDEAHYLQSPSTKRTKLALGIAHQTGVSLWLLTGTPLWSTPRSLFATLAACGQWPLDRYAGNITKAYHAFTVKFCDGRWIWRFRRKIWDDTGASNQDELRDLLGAVMLRRTKEECLPDLPTKQRQIVRLDSRISREERALEFNPDEVKDGKIPPASPIATAVKETGLAKLPEALRHIRDVLATEEKVVLFAWNREVIEILARELAEYSVVTLHGGTKPEEKDRAVRLFQETAGTRVFIGQTAAAGTGLTLTAASVVLFIQPDWTPAVLTQAEDRCHRIGQHRAVTVQYLLTRGSIEDEMVSRAIMKMGLADYLVHGTKRRED